MSDGSNSLLENLFDRHQFGWIGRDAVAGPAPSIKIRSCGAISGMNHHKWFEPQVRQARPSFAFISSI